MITLFTAHDLRDVLKDIYRRQGDADSAGRFITYDGKEIRWDDISQDLFGSEDRTVKTPMLYFYIYQQLVEMFIDELEKRYYHPEGLKLQDEPCEYYDDFTVDLIANDPDYMPRHPDGDEGAKSPR